MEGFRFSSNDRMGTEWSSRRNSNKTSQRREMQSLFQTPRFASLRDAVHRKSFVRLKEFDSRGRGDSEDQPGSREALQLANSRRRRVLIAGHACTRLYAVCPFFPRRRRDGTNTSPCPGARLPTSLLICTLVLFVPSTRLALNCAPLRLFNRLD